MELRTSSFDFKGVQDSFFSTYEIAIGKTFHTNRNDIKAIPYDR